MNHNYPELENCTVCPHNCGVNRYQTTGFCMADNRLKINLAQIHHGEEPVLSGSRGSGTIFLSHCNLRCVFCQNHNISHLGWGEYVTEADCAELILKLQDAGAHNINLVSPTHYTPQLKAAIKIAKDKGLNIPIVWNSNAFEKPETLRQLTGLVDIYLPDFKYAHTAYARKYSSAPDYPDVALAALKEMYHQVGNLQIGSDGLAKRGLLVRHLVLPNRLSGTRETLNILLDNFSSDLALSLMAQYYPTAEASRLPELSRGITSAEYAEAQDIADSLGFKTVFTQELSATSDWTPDFHVTGSSLNEDKLHFRGKENNV